jgi:hypothetical protein
VPALSVPAAAPLALVILRIGWDRTSCLVPASLVTFGAVQVEEHLVAVTDHSVVPQALAGPAADGGKNGGGARRTLMHGLPFHVPPNHRFLIVGAQPARACTTLVSGGPPDATHGAQCLSR